MKKITGIGIWLLITLSFLIPKINYESTSYAKISKTITNYEILSLANGGDNTMGISVWNKNLEQEEIYVWGIGRGDMFDEEEVIFYEPFNISDKFGDLLISGGHVQTMSFLEYNSGVVIEDINGYDHVFTWGYNDYGQTGTGLSQRVVITYPTEITDNFGNLIIEGGEVTNFSIEYSSVLTITDIYNQEHVFSWGSKTENGLGYQSDLPVEMTNAFYDQNGNLILENDGKIIDSSSSKGTNFLAVEDSKKQDHLFAWGYNSDYRAGTADISVFDYLKYPEEISSGSLENDLSNGYHIITVDNASYTSGMLLKNSEQQSAIYFWGGNEASDGALGWGDQEYLITPTKSNQLFGDFLVNNTVKDLAMGYANTMIVFENKLTGQDSLFMAGDNINGQMGMGQFSSDNFNYFINVTDYMPDLNEDGKVLDIKMNEETSYMFESDIDGNTHLYSWGGNYLGELGIGDESVRQSFSPVEVLILEN